LKKGQNVVKVPITVQNPILWWSNGLGVPHQYVFRFSLEQNQQKIEKRRLKLAYELSN
jgi:beta-mannosidase